MAEPGLHPPDFRFERTAADPGGRARVGRLHTRRGVVDTPAFMPVGTRAAVKGLTAAQVRDTGAQIVLANTFHLLLRPGPELIRAMGGLSEWMNWHGPVLTDSGGYQVFSLGRPRAAGDDADEQRAGAGRADDGRRNSAEAAGRESPGRTAGGKPLRTVDDDGVDFRSPLDGSAVRMTPESAVDVQLALGADIIMAFDECPPHPCPPVELERAVDRTTAWAKRCAGRLRERADAGTCGPPALFGITQGGLDRALRRRSGQELTALDLPGYAIGGLSVGEPTEERAALLAETVPDLPADRPRYLMGVGTPLDIVRAAGCGVDLFDCVLPTRNGRNGFAFTRTGILRLRNEQFREDRRPLDEACGCGACRGVSRSYLRHLFLAGEMSGPILLSLHNLTFYQDLMRGLREAIGAGRFAEFARGVSAVWSRAG
jgi:queuine tRNA-ribosyltransferase